jgi:SPX domain protein involved in polyphosphate accumulation
VTSKYFEPPKPKIDMIQVSRYEFKYLLTSDEVPDVRKFLLRYCIQDANADGAEWYGIRSLYLDTPDYAFYRASTEKAVERLKLRVRGYARGNGPLKLEIKRRIGDVISKKSMLTSRAHWSAIAERGLSSLIAEGDGSQFPFLRLVEQMRAAPKVLVTYERSAFHSTIDDYVRVTFDRKIVCQPMHHWRLEGNPRLWRAIDDPGTIQENDSTYVLELKFQLAPPAWLHDLVTALSLTRRGFSKYARSVTRIQPDRDPAWDLRTRWVPAGEWRVA